MPGRSAEHLRQVLDASGEGVYSIDLDGNCTYANRRACEMLGYTLEELLGSHVHRLVHHTHGDGSPYPETDCPIFHATRDGREHRVSGDVFWRKDLSRFSVSYSSLPIIAPDGAIVGASVVFSDESRRIAVTADRDRNLRRLVTEAAETIRLADLARKLDSQPELAKRLEEAQVAIAAIQEELRRGTETQLRTSSDAST